ncbi:MAG TPA: response regulator transcription factor [Armatimonadota bacterium]|nr:response regulator transcription factor [Armatimonadota bacterium]
MKEVRILVADDHKILRDGLCVLLTQQSEFHVIGEASDGQMAFEQAKSLQPDIVIMDIGMPRLNGIEATQRIRSEAPDCKIIGLSMRVDLRSVLQMFHAGAYGYIVKHAGYEELTMAIESVMNGQRFISPEIGDLVLEVLLHQTTNQMQMSYSNLTSREREVLQLLSEGYTTKDISSMLRLAVNTVESYRRHIMEKLNLHNIAKLTRFAIREGLTPIDV